MPIAIRRVTPADAALFASRRRRLRRTHPSRASAAYLAAPGHIMVLAFDGDLVVGQCAGVIHHHPDKVTELYVDEVGTATAICARASPP